MTEEQVTWSASDIAAAQASLDKCTPGEVTALLALTDEEIVILDGLQHPQLVATPWLSQQPGDPKVLCQVALRSLLCRGLVEPAAGDGPDEVVISAVPDVTGPLVLRRTGMAILIATRTVSDGEQHAYFYRHEDDRVVEEQVDENGFHALCVYELGLLGERLAQFADPMSVATSDGQPTTISAAAWSDDPQSLPQLADTRVLTQLTSLHAGSDTVRVVTLYATADTLYVLQGGQREGEGASDQLTLTPAGPKRLRELPGQMLAHP